MLSAGRGGLKNPVASGATRLLLEHIVKLVAGEGGRFTVYMKGLGERDSVVAMPCGQHGVEIGFDADFNLNLLDVVGLADRDVRSMAARIVKLFDPATDFQSVPCLVLLEKLWGTGSQSCKHLPFLKQLVWLLGCRLDESVCAASRDSSSVLVGLQNEGDFDTEHFVALYHQACSDVGSGPLLHLSAACDKSRVHTMNLSNCAFALPDNHCWWGVPQE
jgi:hypothetical protein